MQTSLKHEGRVFSSNANLVSNGKHGMSLPSVPTQIQKLNQAHVLT